MRSGVRLARASLLALLSAGLVAVFASVPAAAINSVGMVVLNVSDCQTGQPIATGEADFAVIHQFAVGVAPIVDGVAGPVGLGANHYKLTITSPGYHPLTRVFWGNGDFSTLTTLEYCLHPLSP